MRAVKMKEWGVYFVAPLYSPSTTPSLSSSFHDLNLSFNGPKRRRNSNRSNPTSSSVSTHNMAATKTKATGDQKM